MNKSAKLLLPVALLLVAGEAGVRISNADARLMRPLLRYRHAEQTCLIPSDNPELIYKLAPGTALQSGGKPPVVINADGMRDIPRSTVKPAGIYRIICLGGDNTFGENISVQNSYPAALEKILNTKYRGKFEVWNAGVPNGTLAYQTAWARDIVKLYSPDLLLFRTGDRGPRAFIRGQPIARYFYENPSLYLENLRFLLVPANSTLYDILHKSALFRFTEVFCNNLILINQNNPLFNPDGFSSDRLNIIYLSDYFKQNHEVPALLLLNANFPGDELRQITDLCGKKLPQIVDCFTNQYLPMNATDEYFIKRPPEHVHKWYAESLARELERLGYVRKK
ncbi:MAG: hypothetical protein GX410_02215 [Elusimicrobia bacterium]|nr:hypothetical protein [Elusimicrobiota bacterium]